MEICIEAVERCLKSWRCRGLSYSGKAIVINALALSRIWYVASLVFFPSWARVELNRPSFLFFFFWSGKKDLVARKVLVHPYTCAGFSVVSIDFEVQSLLVQWIRRLLVSPNGWVNLFDV